jgi:polyhydroxyalkanoate synthase
VIPHSNESWAQASQQFQQTLTEGWNQAFQAFQNMDLGGMPAAVPGMPAVQAPPRIQFAPDKLQALYLLNARTLMGLADAVRGRRQDPRARIRFAVEQWMAASAPSNFLALNAEAQKKAIDTKGESIAKGMQNLLHDMRQGHVSMTDESVFEVGRNVATTEGAWCSRTSCSS